MDTPRSDAARPADEGTDQLDLNRETVRDLDATEERDPRGGFPIRSIGCTTKCTLIVCPKINL